MLFQDGSVMDSNSGQAFVPTFREVSGRLLQVERGLQTVVALDILDS